MKRVNDFHFHCRCSLNGCFYHFETEVKRQIHERCHTSTDVEKIRQFKCVECHMETKMWRNCTSHMWKKHKIDIDLLKCSFCTYKDILSGEFARFFAALRPANWCSGSLNVVVLQLKSFVTCKYTEIWRDLCVRCVPSRSINSLNCDIMWPPPIWTRIVPHLTHDGTRRKHATFARMFLPIRKRYQNTSKPFTIE